MSANQSNLFFYKSESDFVIGYTQTATKSKVTQQPTIFFLLTSMVRPIHFQCQGAASAEHHPCITMTMKRPADAIDTPINFPKNHDGQKCLGEAF
jgi:hypothetical protein